jgi:Ca2+-binding RTX toxin-like protein
LSFTTIQGGNGVDSFIGTSGVDVLVAFNVNKLGFVGAQADNDLVRIEQPETGVTSIFTVYGGNGSDDLTVDSALEFSIVNGNVGNDSIEVCNTVAQSLITGGQGNDSLEVGDLINSTYSGGQGDDVLGFCGEDFYNGEDFFPSSINSVIANSIVNGNAGNDLIDGSGVQKITNSVIYGGDNNDTLRDFFDFDSTGITLNGNKGNDVVEYAGFSDGVTLFGGEGDDTLETFNSAAYLSGDLGNDTIFGSDSGDTIRGADGNDSLVGFDGDDEIRGGTGDDYVEGGFGNDTLFGGEGNDTFGIFGEDGFNGDYDFVTGGAGSDTYTAFGQTGNETYFINAVSESSASTTGGTWDIFNAGSFDGFDFPGDTLDISAVSSILAGGPSPNNIFLTELNLGEFESLGDLKAELDSVGYQASDPNGLRGYYLNFTINAEGPATPPTTYTTLWIQNNQVSFTSDDLLFQFNGGESASDWISSNDIAV